MDAITPAATVILAISIASGRVVGPSFCLIRISFADLSPSVAARVFDSPSVSVPVTRRMGAGGGGEPLEFGLDGMPSFSAIWIEKSCGPVG